MDVCRAWLSRSGPRESSCEALIVGGGPAGYAAALALAQSGYKDIRLLERHPSPDYVDPNRTFTYFIMWPGKDAMRALGVRDVEATGRTLVGKRKALTVMPDGKQKTRELGPPSGTPREVSPTELSRGLLIKLLRDNAERVCGSRLRVTYATRATSVELPVSGTDRDATRRAAAPPRPVVVASGPPRGAGRGSKQQEERIRCRLLIAADGVGSLVRKALVEAYPEGQYGLATFDCPSGGMGFKVLPLPGNEPLVRGMPPPSEGSFSMSFPARPVGGDAPIHFRTFGYDAALQVTFAMPEGHGFWHITEVAAFYDYMARAVPQCDNLRAAMPRETVEAFLAARLDRFPHVQHSRSLTCGFGDAGVVLLGDAAHAFPPDLGLGATSALDDARGFLDALQQHPGKLGDALAAYEESRLPETEALCQIMAKYNAPWQYASLGSKFQRAWWMGSMILRALLSKIMPSLFGPMILQQIMFKAGIEERMSFRDLFRRQEAITQRIAAMCCVLLAMFILAVTKATGYA